MKAIVIKGTVVNLEHFVCGEHTEQEDNHFVRLVFSGAEELLIWVESEQIAENVIHNIYLKLSE